jgi:hypothetical protein
MPELNLWREGLLDNTLEIPLKLPRLVLLWLNTTTPCSRIKPVDLGFNRLTTAVTDSEDLIDFTDTPRDFFTCTFP